MLLTDNPRAALDRYDVLLLDMCQTFMFDCDRFGEDEDFFATYRRLGGKRLLEHEVDFLIRATLQDILDHYHNPAHYDNFPSVEQALEKIPESRVLPVSERQRLIDVFAYHEQGVVPTPYVQLLGELSRTHRLAVLSNIWAPRARFDQELARCGLDRVFSAVVFSSDTRSIKPSPRLFQAALDAMGVEADRALMIGDSLTYDVAGAKSSGIDAMWIGQPQSEGAPSPERPPDYVIGDLLELSATG